MSETRPVSWLDHEKILNELQSLERTNNAAVTMFCRRLHGRVETSANIRRLLEQAAQNASPENDWKEFIGYMAWDMQPSAYRDHISSQYPDSLHQHCLHLSEIQRLVLNG